ncbi:hypothetical protein P2318_04655 [Myxococcaceae bacterium GXIMD 01537]
MIRSLALRFLAGLSLLFCAAGLPAPAHANPETLLAGCTAAPFGGEGWSYECGDFKALIADHEGVSTQVLWQRSRRTFKRQAAGGATFEVETVRLAGRKTRLLRMRPKGAREQEASVFAVLPAKGRGARQVLCKTRDTPEHQAHCRRVLEQLAGNPWRALPEVGVAVSQSDAALAGRELSVPDGCNLTAERGGARLECADGSRLDWTQLPDASRLAAFVRESVLTFKDVTRTTWMESRLPCAIDGARTECTYLRMLDSSERREVYVAGAVVRGMPTLVSCVAGRPSRLLPQACQQVLSFR